MACFLVPLTQAIATTVYRKHAAAPDSFLGRNLPTLEKMLWGGSVLLAFEHIWHGEVVAWFPFLTAMSDPNDAAEMFHEMATVGVSMASLITVIWLGMCFVADKIMKRSEDKEVEPETV